MPVRWRNGVSADESLIVGRGIKQFGVRGLAAFLAAGSLLCCAPARAQDSAGHAVPDGALPSSLTAPVFAPISASFRERLSSDSVATDRPAARSPLEGPLFAETDEQSGSAEQGAAPSVVCIFCGDYWRLLKGDVKHVFSSPTRWQQPQWRSVGWKAIAVVGAMALLDKSTRKYFDNHKTATSDRLATNFQPFGRQYAAYVIGGYLLAGDLFHKPKAKAIAVDGLTTTVIAAGLIVPALKLIAGRSRPRADLGAHDFHPFTGGYSFPSGHATAAFSVAATIATHYHQLWVKGLSYGIASMVGYARMEKDAHYLSDVTAGAMIGIGVARSVNAFNRGRHPALAIRPIEDPRSPRASGIDISFEFAMR